MIPLIVYALFSRAYKYRKHNCFSSTSHVYFVSDDICRLSLFTLDCQLLLWAITLNSISQKPSTFRYTLTFPSLVFKITSKAPFTWYRMRKVKAHDIILKNYKTSATLKFMIIFQNLTKPNQLKSGEIKCDRKPTDLDVVTT